MEAHLELSDQQFVQKFASGTLPPALFTHQAHLRLAWIYIHNLGISEAAHRASIDIKAFATRHGDPDKYHHTLTVAAVQVVHHFINKSSATGFVEFISEFPVLTKSFKSLILSHYTPKLIFSNRAKRQYLTPDLLAFDYAFENQADID